MNTLNKMNAIHCWKQWGCGAACLYVLSVCLYVLSNNHCSNLWDIVNMSGLKTEIRRTDLSVFSESVSCKATVAVITVWWFYYRHDWWHKQGHVEINVKLLHSHTHAAHRDSTWQLELPWPLWLNLILVFCAQTGSSSLVNMNCHICKYWIRVLEVERNKCQ